MGKYIPRKPKWIIIGKDKVTNTLYGYIEQSFSMSISPKAVRVWRNNGNTSDEDYVNELFKVVNYINKKYNNIKFDLYRVGSKKCPVKINWKLFWKLKSGKKTIHKFDFRNLQFLKK